MKNYLFIATCFIVFSFSCNQKSINNPEKRNENWVWFVDKDTKVGKWTPINVGNPVQSGQYTKFFPNGNIYEKGTILHAKQVDTSFLFDINEKLIKYKIFLKDSSYDYIVNDGYYESFYHTTGKILEKGTAKNHILGGKWSRYYKSGKLEFKHTINGNSKWRIGYYEAGQLKDSILYLNDKRNGFAKFWHENGNLYEVSNWKGAKKNGLEFFYHENGQIHEKSTWINGVHEGPDTLWFDNGQISQITINHLGKANGYTEIWYPNGNFKFKGTFKNGLYQDKCIVYRENGTINTFGYFKDNEPHGEVKSYDNKGLLLKSFYYENGKMEGKQKFYTNGKLDEINVYENGELIEVKEIE